ncbi:hypothetical protein J437_LFUL016928 [Ladona fulva]|uniref:Protein G12 n=1 Tax=Ladona fulva TaxID=123851 RepID=A0A8K0KNA3_LADFU|nr:hypothetical protein J437_LFUL016928 [Ladona fulva]
MKFSLVFCAILGISFGAVVHHESRFYDAQNHSTRNLGDLLKELMSLIPVDKIAEIVVKYVETDPEVQEAVAYLKSDDFKKIVTTVEDSQQFKDLAAFLDEAGLDIYDYIKFINDILGIHTMKSNNAKLIRSHNTRSLMDMVNDILAVIPLDKIKQFYHDKVENDPEFQELLRRLRSPEFKELAEAVRSMPEFADMLDRLKKHGIDVDTILQKINDFFGWGFYSLIHKRSLGDLLNELLSMIPVDKIIEIVTNYIENDPEVQEAVAFLKSDEFKSLVEKIQSMPQYMEYLEYLYNAGIDIYTYINYIHGLLGLPPVHRPGSFHHSTRSLMGMIQDILNVLPIEEMKKFYHEKVENDPDFQALLEKLKSDEFKNIVESIRNMPEYMDMMDRLRSHGIDVDAIRKKINDFFGW